MLTKPWHLAFEQFICIYLFEAFLSQKLNSCLFLREAQQRSEVQRYFMHERSISLRTLESP